MSESITFHPLPHPTVDLVLSVHHNLYGNRMVTASSDHHLRVWDKKAQEWILTDTWRAHDGEITDVRWASPFTGALIASISTDTTCKLWLESPTTTPNAHFPQRPSRWKHIHTLPSKTLLPFTSLSFKTPHPDPLLALTTADGNLSIHEPRNDLTEWTDWFSAADFWVRDPPPPRSEETSFALAWHAERLPAWPALDAGLDRKSLGLAVAAMDVVKVFRTDRDRRLYLAAELTGAADLVRGVAWANGSMRGFDVLASASKDGVVRVYELHTPRVRPAAQTTQVSDAAGELDNVETTGTAQRWKQTRSGIGAGLAEMSRTGEDAVQDPSRIKQDARCVAELRGHRGAVWRVAFSFTGELLMSTGDDGTVRTWKQDVDGSWGEYAEIDVEALQEDAEEERNGVDEEGEG